MIVLPRTAPLQMLQHEVLNRRLPSLHPLKEHILQQAKNYRAGYNGEKSLDYTLAFLPDDYLILHGLTLNDHQGDFQIDTLILTKRFGLIVEVKNIPGTIEFDDMGQAIRTSEGTEDNFGNPIEQVNLQHLRLQEWLQSRSIQSVPFEKRVVYSNSRTILKNTGRRADIADCVIHRESLIFQILQLNDRYTSDTLSSSRLRNLSNRLANSHHPAQINVLKKYSIAAKELLLGVACPSCDTLPMTWHQRRWNCGQCGFTSKNAHLNALKDYRLLIGNEINNKQARAFLKVDSVRITNRMLIQTNFKQVGKTKDRKYVID